MKANSFIVLGSVVVGSVVLVAACTAQTEPSEAPQPRPELEAPPPAPIRPTPDDGVEVSGDLLPPIPVAVTSFGAARANQALFVMGGYHGEPHHYDREGQSNALWRLGLGPGDRWEQVGEMDHGLQGLALVSIGDEVCRIGGTRILNDKGEAARMLSVPDVACFHTSKRTWRALPPLPSGRSSHEATVVGHTIWVAGGWRLGASESAREEGGGPSDAVWHHDAVSLDLSAADPAWRSTPAPFERRALEVSTRHGEVVVIGGLGPDRSVSPAIDILDPATGKWRRGPDYPTDSFGVAATEVRGEVYASARDGRVLRLDDNAWTPVAQLAFPRFFHRLVGLDDGLAAVSGITGMQSMGRTRHTERVLLTTNRALPTPKVDEWVMPYPGRAKNRFGMLLAGDALYLFGGNNSLGQHDFAVENFLDEGYRLHLPSMRIESVAGYPAKRQTMQTVSVGALGISVGGFGHPREASDSTEAVSHSDGFVFDFASEQWRPRGGLPRGRTQFGLAEHDGTLWIFGGLNYDPSRSGPDAFDHVTSILTAPLTGDAAFELADVTLPGSRRAFAGAALGDSYYLVGGMKEGFQLVDDCQRFSFHDNTFEAFPCPKEPRLSGDLVALGGKLYLVGGSLRRDGEMTSSRSIDVFDPGTSTWSQLLADVGFDTKHARALAYRDRLLLVSSHMPEPRLRVLLIAPNGENP